MDFGYVQSPECSGNLVNTSSLSEIGHSSTDSSEFPSKRYVVVYSCYISPAEDAGDSASKTRESQAGNNVCHLMVGGGQQRPANVDA